MSYYHKNSVVETIERSEELNTQILEKVEKIYDKMIKMEKHFDSPELEERMDTVSAAEYIGFHRNTMANMRSKGLGPRYTKVGRLVLYRKKDLDEYMSTRVVDPRGGNRKWRD